MPRRASFLLVPLAALAGCFPSFGSDECFSNADCQGGRVCQQNVCVAGGGDAGSSDAGSSDTGTADVGAVDAGADAGAGPDVLSIVSLDPAPNDTSGDQAEINAIFDRPMMAANEASFIINDFNAGRAPGNYTGAGTPSLAFVPTNAFSAGSPIEVTLRPLLRSEDGSQSLPVPFVYRFWAEVGTTAASFTGPTSFNTAGAPQGVAQGDVNGDGNLDLIWNDAAKVGVALGDGNLAFAHDVNYDVTGFHAALGVGDVSGDGLVDLVLGDNMTVRAHVGSGTGFAPRGVISGVPGAERLALGDFSGDGNLDAVGVYPSGSQGDTTSNVWAATGNGGGSFTKIQDIEIAPGTVESAREIRLGDFDNDGRLDLFVLYGRLGSEGVTIYVLRNLGGQAATRFETVQTAVSATLASIVDAMVLGDFDGDGRLDVAIGDRLNVQLAVYLNTGTGLGQPITTPGTVDAMTVGDVDGDEDLDIVTNGGVLLHQNSGIFAPGATVGVQFPILGDYDGDGDLDIGSPGDVFCNCP